MPLDLVLWKQMSQSRVPSPMPRSSSALVALRDSPVIKAPELLARLLVRQALAAQASPTQAF